MRSHHNRRPPVAAPGVGSHGVFVGESSAAARTDPATPSSRRSAGATRAAATAVTSAGTSAAAVATAAGTEGTSASRCRCRAPPVTFAAAEQPHCCRAAARPSTPPLPSTRDGASTATAADATPPQAAVSPSRTI